MENEKMTFVSAVCDIH